ncbi:hypothetical protein MBLNU13_g10605t1 [Cladosporium sp. NU13]
MVKRNASIQEALDRSPKRMQLIDLFLSVHLVLVFDRLSKKLQQQTAQGFIKPIRQRWVVLKELTPNLQLLFNTQQINMIDETMDLLWHGKAEKAVSRMSNNVLRDVTKRLTWIT